MGDGFFEGRDDGEFGGQCRFLLAGIQFGDSDTHGFVRFGQRCADFGGGGCGRGGRRCGRRRRCAGREQLFGQVGGEILDGGFEQIADPDLPGLVLRLLGLKRCSHRLFGVLIEILFGGQDAGQFAHEVGHGFFRENLLRFPQDDKCLVLLAHCADRLALGDLINGRGQSGGGLAVGQDFLGIPQTGRQILIERLLARRGQHFEKLDVTVNDTLLGARNPPLIERSGLGCEEELLAPLGRLFAQKFLGLDDLADFFDEAIVSQNRAGSLDELVEVRDDAIDFLVGTVNVRQGFAKVGAGLVEKAAGSGHAGGAQGIDAFPGLDERRGSAFFAEFIGLHVFQKRGEPAIDAGQPARDVRLAALFIKQALAGEEDVVTLRPSGRSGGRCSSRCSSRCGSSRCGSSSSRGRGFVLGADRPGQQDGHGQRENQEPDRANEHFHIDTHFGFWSVSWALIALTCVEEVISASRERFNSSVWAASSALYHSK